jgi:CTP:phosphocholine cytidylyltransferase-like protein/thiamine kinase-like enzyme
MKNAVILAAGKSSRFAPFTYEKPKGLFRVKGVVLIERLIEQLIEAGIEKIFVVVGYMKEKFFYLELKYPQVRLLINNKFGYKGNLYSVYVARKYFCNTFLCYADQYFINNPFRDNNEENQSYRTCVFRDYKFNEFSIESSDANVITSVDLSGNNQLAMAGFAYFNESFSRIFMELLENEIDDFRVPSLFWEEFYGRHIKKLTLYAKLCDSDNVLEFNTIEDLKHFDADFLRNVGSEIVVNICIVLNCEANEISDINVINAGLTNVSFSFVVNGARYVYRHPGGTAGNLINRDAEDFIQKKAKDFGIDKSFIMMSRYEGWKLSYCVENLVEANFRKYPEQLLIAMEYLRKIHSIAVDYPIKRFDDYEEGLKLIKIASATKGNLFQEFASEIEKARVLNDFLKKDAKRLGIKSVYCHNDVYEPNFLVTSTNDMYLIDWEYAGLNDPANDLACFFSRYDYSISEIDTFLEAYFQRKPSKDERYHYLAYIPLCAFYWISWGLYKGSVGDDDGFFFLPAYRNFHRYIDNALNYFNKMIW